MARDLRKAGFKDVMILKGGLGAWTNAGLPIETRTDISPVGVELYKASSAAPSPRHVSKRARSSGGVTGQASVGFLKSR